MAFEWTEKENKRNIIYAEDINSMAREVIRLENDKANKSNSLFGYGIEDAYTINESDEKFAKKSTTLKGYGIEDAYTKEESDGKFAFKETIYTKSEIDEKIQADITPTENSTNLITSGGVFDALQPFVFDCTLRIPPDQDWLMEPAISCQEISNAYKRGLRVIAQTNIEYVDDDNNLIRTSSAELLCMSRRSEHPNAETYMFKGFSGTTLITMEVGILYGSDMVLVNVTQLADKEYVDTAIGDIETSLENIIAKYGLGGEA